MKELLIQFATYNIWANTRLSEAVLVAGKEHQQTPITSSFGSIQATVYHLMNVEYLWWQRIKLVESPQPIPEGSLSVEEMIRKLLEMSNQWKDWIEKSTVNALEHEFVYQNTKKEQFKQPIYQMLLHLFNHQTYHRGQIVLMLRQVGVDKIPATDFIIWSRQKKH